MLWLTGSTKIRTASTVYIWVQDDQKANSQQERITRKKNLVRKEMCKGVVYYLGTSTYLYN
jgi:hypothetical protein